MTHLLDGAVFDLFETTQEERDLVDDFWAESHDLYWKGAGSAAGKRVLAPYASQGTRLQLPENPARGDLQRYLAAFLDAWNPHLPKGTELTWEVATSPGRDAICVAFVPSEPGNAKRAQSSTDWQSMVARCAAVLARPVSAAFHTNRVVRAATADGFVVLRAIARRLWTASTASTAREDAQALFVQLASRAKG